MLFSLWDPRVLSMFTLDHFPQILSNQIKSNQITFIVCYFSQIHLESHQSRPAHLDSKLRAHSLSDWMM